jgi:3'-phosphoadenosine 5'-phosphosulfate sulfotransferase (PAPS reductase)/FAD synthetase
VLLHLVREDYPNVPAVFVDTGLEYPEIREFALIHIIMGLI